MFLWFCVGSLTPSLLCKPSNIHNPLSFFNLGAILTRSGRMKKWVFVLVQKFLFISSRVHQWRMRFLLIFVKAHTRITLNKKRDKLDYSFCKLLSIKFQLKIWMHSFWLVIYFRIWPQLFRFICDLLYIFACWNSLGFWIPYTYKLWKYG